MRWRIHKAAEKSSIWDLHPCEGVSELLSIGKAAAYMGDVPTMLALNLSNSLTGSGHYKEIDAVDRIRDAILLSEAATLWCQLVGVEHVVVE